MSKTSIKSNKCITTIIAERIMESHKDYKPDPSWKMVWTEEVMTTIAEFDEVILDRVIEILKRNGYKIMDQ